MGGATTGCHRGLMERRKLREHRGNDDRVESGRGLRRPHEAGVDPSLSAERVRNELPVRRGVGHLEPATRGRHRLYSEINRQSYCRSRTMTSYTPARISTPSWWRLPIFSIPAAGIEAVNAGRDTMSKSPLLIPWRTQLPCAVLKTGKIVQVGTQRRSAPAISGPMSTSSRVSLATS